MHTSPELEDDSRYSQVSPAAVFALLLGLTSPLAFIGPPFFIFPALAVGVGLLALGKIRRSDGALTGETLARVAIALGLGCLAGALVRTSVRDTLMQRQAVAAAQRWLGLLADGRIPEAKELLTGDAKTTFVPSPVAMQGQQLTNEEAEQLVANGLRSNALTKALAGQKDPGILETSTAPVYAGPKATVLVKFAIEDSSDGGHRHLEVQMARSPAYEGSGQPWRVDRWQTGDAHEAH
jgi:hypothetical protein